MARMNFKNPPGATPITDCSGLKLPWVQPQEELNRAETENIALALSKYLTNPISSPLKWFEPSTLLKIHREMFGKIWEWAGTYRKGVTNIGSAPYMIPSMVAELCSDVKSWSMDAVELTFLERSVQIHHRLVCIHPFENGNGRFSRLVADRYLMYWGCDHPIWPVELQKDGSSRDVYLQCLKSADKHDYTPLTKFIESLGGQDPSLTEIQSSPFYKKKLNPTQRLALMRSYARLKQS